VKFTLEEDEEAVRWIVSPEQDLARLDPHLVALLRKPGEILLGLVAEYFVLPQVFDETHNFARY
jgi:hypothetical protein